MKLPWSLSGAGGVCRLAREREIFKCRKLRFNCEERSVVEMSVSQELCAVTVLQLLFGVGLSHVVPGVHGGP